MVITGKFTSYTLISVKIFHIISYYHLQNRKFITGYQSILYIFDNIQVLSYPPWKTRKNLRLNPNFKLLDQVRETLRYYHYARSTEKTYCQWIMRYIYFFEKKVHPIDMGEKEVERFLSHLATNEKVAASTQRQSLNALVFFYRDVLLKPLDNSIAPVRSKRKRRPRSFDNKPDNDGVSFHEQKLKWGCCYLPRMPDMAKWVNTDLSKGFSVLQVAQKHGWPEPMVWSQALVNKDDLSRFKALQWGLRTWYLWNFTDCDKRFGDEWPCQKGGSKSICFTGRLL